MHDDEVEVPPALVAELVRTRFPDWAGLPLTALHGTGTVNAVFRLGEDLVVRLPRRPGPAAQLPAELAATRELFGRTRFPTPEVVAVGDPGAGYPFSWSVVRWIPGTPADEVGTADAQDLAADLAEFVRGVRDLSLHGRRFSGDGRGGDLHRHDGWVRECFERSGELLDVPALRALWERYLRLPHVSADVVTHGDLVPGNVLITGGRLAGVLDVGGLGPADPALDLIAGWHLFEGAARERFRAGCAGGDLDWVRGQAWAFVQAVGLVWYYVRSNPRMSSLGARTLARIVADPLV